jgi:DNA-binding transcriptional ArsR family regulator
MPVSVDDYLSRPVAPAVSVELEPVYNMVYSLLLLAREEETSGLSDWVVQTAHSMSAEERRVHRVVLDGLHYAVLPRRSWQSFPDYLDYLSRADPAALRDQMLDTYLGMWVHMQEISSQESANAVARMRSKMLSSPTAYVEFLSETFSSMVTPEVEQEAYNYTINPPAMKELIVRHLRMMWESFLAPEWARVRPMLQESVEAFRRIDLMRMPRLETARLVTGQPVGDERKHLKDVIENSRKLVFIPSAHVGANLGIIHHPEMGAVLFQARVPEEAASQAPNLSRAEIIVRLSALADDTRLRILKYITDNGEQRAQDIIKSLDLSQSAASRHLSQLSAAGYLIERRVEGAKSYAINPERIQGALGAVSRYLSKAG